MSFQSLSTSTGKNLIHTLDVDQFGETITPTKREQELYTELVQLSKRYPVIVNLSGTKYDQAVLHSISLDHLEVYDWVAPVPHDHVMVTLSSQRWDGSTIWTIDKIDVYGKPIDLFQ